MRPNYDIAANYGADLKQVISAYRHLADGLAFESDGEEVVTVVCDVLKAKEFAEPDNLDRWLELKAKINVWFETWISSKVDWQPLARLVVTENSLLFADDGEFSRIMKISCDSLPFEVSSFIHILISDEICRRAESNPNHEPA